MSYILAGCAAFVFLYIFDLNKIFGFHRFFNLFFGIGIVMLGVATLGVSLRGEQDFFFPGALHIFFWILALGSFGLLLYALFFALPFSKTYVELNKANQVIDSGMYALCRHPGVIWFFMMYMFLWLASGRWLVLLAGLIWTVMDVIHVYVQDRWIFPKTLEGYDKYQQRTPFLIPNRSSLKKSMENYHWRHSGDTQRKIRTEKIR